MTVFTIKSMCSVKNAYNIATRLWSNGVTVTKYLQLLMISELYLELSYFFS